VFATCTAIVTGTMPPTRCTLTYNANGDMGSMTPQSGDVGDSVTVADNGFTAPAGYEFANWNTQADGSGDSYESGDEITLTTNLTLYAKWSATGEDPDEENSGLANPDDTGVSDWLDTVDHNAYLQGCGNGQFRPSANLTRAEVAQMLYNLLLDKNVDQTVSFADVPGGQWCTTAVRTLASLIILEGYGDGVFAPNAAIIRAEMTAIANRMLGQMANQSYIDANADSLTVRFTDNDPSNWAYYDIVEATNSHSYTKTEGAEQWTDLTQA